MTPIQQRMNYPNLTNLEGTTLDGAYVLGQCLGADERTVIFKAQVKAGYPARAIVKIYRAEASVADEQIALWEGIKKLKHPNLAAIVGSGRTKLQAQELIYVAVEPADEMLDSVLRGRALDSTEAGDLVVSICRGLEHLHATGFVHACLSPEEVLGVGDSIKLSTEGVRKAESTTDIGLKEAKYRAPESPNGNVTPEADVWCLGATLFEAITQKECVADARNEAAKLPVPFGSIIHRCLYTKPEARCTLQEVMQLYEGRLRAFSAAAGAGAGAESGVRELHEAPRNSVLSPSRAHTETTQAASSKGAERHVHGGHTGRLQRRILAYTAIGLFLVLGLIWLARPRKSERRSSAVTSATKAAAPRRESVSPAQKAAPRVSRPVTSQLAPAQVNNGSTTVAVGSARPHQDRNKEPATDQAHYVNGPVWRVVVYTYDRAADAENRARLINERHPDLKAEMFSPSGNSGPYLVVIGGEMSRENAVTLCQEARSLGLPRDTYLQNYKQ
ncbi:MAG: protein kinase domain-containing protein [Bryobacteraceae bacterium]